MPAMSRMTVLRRHAWVLVIAVALLPAGGCAPVRGALLSPANAADTPGSSPAPASGTGTWTRTTRPSWALSNPSTAVPSATVPPAAAPPSAVPLTPREDDDPTLPADPFDTTQSAPVPRVAPVLPRPVPFDVDVYLAQPIHSVPNDKNEMALTFDDGPSIETPKLLAILAKNDVHATFFFVGKRASSKVGQRIVHETLQQRNDVGDHTWSHSRLENLPPGQLAMQIDRAQTFFAAADGFAPTFVRPRGGHFDFSAVAALMDRNLVLTMWSAQAHDTVPSPSAATIASRVLHEVKSGSIVDLHDRNPQTVKALPAILAGLRAKGLHPVTLSRLFADGAP